MRKFKVNNTTYRRCSKYGVGKEIGYKVYFHKNYADRILSPQDLRKAINILGNDFKYNCMMVDLRHPNLIRFDEAPDFDTASEPHPGDFVEVNLYTLEKRCSHSDYIWHHKWMWVDDDYEGFDVDKSYEWSREWTQIISHPSGSRRVWETQISQIK